SPLRGYGRLGMTRGAVSFQLSKGPASACYEQLQIPRTPRRLRGYGRLGMTRGLSAISFQLSEGLTSGCCEQQQIPRAPRRSPATTVRNDKKREPVTAADGSE